MRTRQEVAQSAAQHLREAAAQQKENTVMLGFDGFVDSIIAMVDQRIDAETFTEMPTIETFGQKVLAASGKSANYEMHIKMRKLGGNGPIMANAMLESGHPTLYLGALGRPMIDPVFEDFASRAEVFSVSDPGYTDALEFSDGKLMLGKLQNLSEVNISNFLEAFGAEKIQELVDRSRLIGVTNWTMLPKMNSIWEYLIEEALPKASAHSQGQRIVFCDLADPEKRTREDLLEALNLFARFNETCFAVLGLNLKESTQVAELLGIELPEDHEAVIESTARLIVEKLGISGVVIHPRAGAASALILDGELKSAYFAGPFVQDPKISTGAGDNFNAGFCVGLLAGLDEAEVLAAGTGTSGFYVRNAKSPSIQELADFCDDLPAPQS